MKQLIYDAHIICGQPYIIHAHLFHFLCVYHIYTDRKKTLFAFMFQLCARDATHCVGGTLLINGANKYMYRDCTVIQAHCSLYIHIRMYKQLERLSSSLSCGIVNCAHHCTRPSTSIIRLCGGGGGGCSGTSKIDDCKTRKRSICVCVCVCERCRNFYLIQKTACTYTQRENQSIRINPFNRRCANPHCVLA